MRQGRNRCVILRGPERARRAAEAGGGAGRGKGTAALEGAMRSNFLSRAVGSRLRRALHLYWRFARGLTIGVRGVGALVRGRTPGLSSSNPRHNNDQEDYAMDERENSPAQRKNCFGVSFLSPNIRS